MAWLDDSRDRIVHIAREIGRTPELGYREHSASALVASVLEDAGHRVERPVAGMDTALRSRHGSTGGVIALLAEYDALPEIGHACGHNLIAASAVGAYLALAAVDPEHRYLLLGCPAEESTTRGAGGKIRLIEAGAFDDVAAAIMIHPYDSNAIVREGALAARGVEFVFHGRAAHAAMAPQEGINALDAVVLMYTSIATLRQQLPDEVRLHGIISDGGTSPNVIPERAALKMRMRAPTLAGLTRLYESVCACARGAATATGASVDIDEFMPPYAEMVQDEPLARIGEGVLDDLGLTRGAEAPRFGSSDFGNVSHVVPALEIGIGISPEGAKPHTAEFATAALSSYGLEAAVSGAKALALTALRYRAEVSDRA